MQRNVSSDVANWPKLGHTNSKNNNNKLRAAHGEGFLDRETKMRSQPTDQMKDLDVNRATWGIFMSVTLQAAVLLGKDYTEDVRSTKKQPKKSVKQLFQMTERLITNQTEVTGLTTIDWKQPMKETTLLTDRDVQFATAKAYVFSDKVPCLGGISTEPVKAWESNIKWFLETRYLKDVDRIDGEQMEFEWTNFPGFTTLQILDEIQKMMTERVNQSNSKEGSSSCQCTMTLVGENEETKKFVLRMLSELLSMLEDSREDTGRFLGPGSEKTWYGTHPR